jgi:hypothetical protein
MKPSDSGFESTPEFIAFKDTMRKILAVPKAELDRRVAAAKAASPRKDNPKAPGRKRVAK